MKWSSKSLDELGEVKRGKSKHRPRDAAHLYGGDYPFIQTGDVKHSGLYVTEYSQTYSEAGLAQSKLWAKGTLCITIAANIADTAILSFDACFPDSIIGFQADPKKSDVRFVKYLMDTLKKHFRQFSQGAAQDNLSLEKLISLKFLVPEVSVQKKIADVLSSYDDLIKINEKKITLMEESARLIYSEWFVHLRFPGHEKVKIVNGIPFGWSKAELNSIADVKSGFAFKNEEYSTQEGIPVVRTRDFSSSIFIDIGEDIRIPTNIAYKYDAYKLKYLDFLLIMVGASIGSFGIVLSPEVGYLQNQNMWSIYSIKDEVPQVFIVETMKFMIKKVMGHKVGAARDFFRKDSVRNLSIVIPTEQILEKFSNAVLPLYEQIDLLRKINKQLVSSKELLMPRLMNGDIEL